MISELLAFAVSVEAPPRLAAQIAGIDHLHQQGAGAVLGIPESSVQNAQDVQADVQSYEICERQGTHTHTQYVYTHI